MRIKQTEPDYAAVSKRVDDEFACKHAHKTVRKKLAADGAISIWHQCDRCGHKVGIAIRKASMTPAQVEALPVWDTQLESKFYADKKKYCDQAYAAEEKRCSGAWHRAYAKYLLTPEWQRKRQLVMLREHGICQGCREAQAVDIHHLTYSNAGEEFLFQLAAFCRECHERWHGLLQPVGGATHQPPAPPSPVPKATVP